MKHFFLFVLLVAPASAQWIVNDPVNTAVNSAVQAGQAANHIEVLRQWAAQLEQLNRQLRKRTVMFANTGPESKSARGGESRLACGGRPVCASHCRTYR